LPGAQTYLGQALRINRKGWCCATPFQRQKITKNPTKQIIVNSGASPGFRSRGG